MPQKYAIVCKTKTIFYIKNNRNTFIVTVWPVCNGGDKIIRDHYSRNSKIIYYKEIKLKSDAYFNFLRHISDKRSHTNGTKLWFAKLIDLSRMLPMCYI